MIGENVTQQPDILLVEDDLELAEWVKDYLTGKGFAVTHTDSGQQAIDIITNTPPELVLLDGMLPDVDGLDVCKSVRGHYGGAIIMLTARDEEIDEVLGLEVGADDYIVKPVRARALLARIRKLLNRQTPATTAPTNASANDVPSIETPTNNQPVVLNGLVIDPTARKVLLRDSEVTISSNEFDVLWLLAEKAGQVVSRQSLISDLRGFDYDGFDRTIDLRISRLRKKLGDDSHAPQLIKTIWGKGYLLAKDGWNSQ